MSKIVKRQSTLTGAAGEHYVMYRLLRMGYIAALAPKGVPNADLIVTNVEGELTAVIQVKTKSKKNANGSFQLKAKHEVLKSKNLFYCLVDDTVEVPIVYCVPSTIIADAIMKSHKSWLSALGKNGRAHKDTDMRWFAPEEKYKENWADLNLG